MSSSEEEYEYSSGSEDGDPDMEDGEDEGAILIANTFYEADDIKDSKPEEAVTQFAEVVRLETEAGDEVKWRFQALQNLVVLHMQLGQTGEMVQRYKEMLKYISQVTGNESLDAINSVLDSVATATGMEVTVLQQMYQITLEALAIAKNDRLFFNTNAKLAKLYLQNGDYKKLEALIGELHQSCKRPDGSDDPSKGTYLMETYALHIQLAVRTGDTSGMGEIYSKVKALSAAINDPRIMGVIHENFGIMWMSQEKWNQAYQEFFDAFRGYSEAGNSQARTCLKYVVLANMLALEEINPFDSQEAKVFKEDPEVNAMWRLRNAYTEKDFDVFYRVLGDPRNKIQSDEFILRYLQPLISSFRSVVILNTIKPYRNVSLDFLARVVKAEREEVESLLVAHILDGEIVGTIDQVRGFLHISGAGSGSGRTYPTLTRLTDQLSQLHTKLQDRLS